MTHYKEPIINHWYKALSTPFGVELVCSNPDSVRSMLYMARKEAKDVDLEGISIVTSPFDPNKLWLVKKRKPSDAQT